MTHFLLSPNDANLINSFDTIKDVIKDDDFSFFLKSYNDIIENFDFYKSNNSNSMEASIASGRLYEKNRDFYDFHLPM